MATSPDTGAPDLVAAWEVHEKVPVEDLVPTNSTAPSLVAPAATHTRFGLP
jgi:hypothetical protein